MVDNNETSLFAVGTALLQNRKKILVWAFIGAIVTALSVFNRPVVYKASASFVLQGSDQSRAGLANLAGQLGFSLPSSAATSSQDFYAILLKSRTLLQRIVRDTFEIREEGRRRAAFLDLFNIKAENAGTREQYGVLLLQDIVTVTSTKPVGLVQVSVVSGWPSVSKRIAEQLLAGINDFNQEARQGQASAERRFLERRLEVTSADLHVAEDSLARFLEANRNLSNSPQLTFTGEQLRRGVNFKQQVVTALAQAYEDARIREVRDTPAIMIVEAPILPSEAEPRGRLRSIMLGFFVGGLLGVMLSFAQRLLLNAKNSGSTDVDVFFMTFAEAKCEVISALRFMLNGRERNLSRVTKSNARD